MKESDTPGNEDPPVDSELPEWDRWVASVLNRMAEDAERVASGELSKSEFHAKYHEERARMADEYVPDHEAPPIDPDDPEWRTWAESILDDTEYDTEFGIELARDARRVTEGSLSETEFHDRYHERTVAEFGMDDRPTKSAVAGTPSESPDGSPLPGIPGENDPTRRSVLKNAAGVGAAAVGLSAFQQATKSAAAQDTGGEGGGTQLGMAIDTERCIACLQCTQACHEENGTAAESLWMYVFRYEEDNYTDEQNWLTRPCQHCTNAPCTNACPTASRYRREEDGLVLTNYDRCVGCRYCEVSCPYGVNYLAWMGGGDDEHTFEGNREIDGRHVAGNPPRGVMGKCTFCAHRQDSGDPDLAGTTACEDVCPTDAIHFGDLEDEESAPRQHIASKSESSVFRLLEDMGTEPNVLYIGNEPSASAEPVEGPTTVEDVGRRKNRPDRPEISAGGTDTEGGE